MIGQIIDAVSVWAIPLLLAITLHEAAHGFAAYWFGDDTARRLGRMSLNPLRHVDPFGTVLMPALLLLAKAPFLFGYAKRVPVNFGRLNHPRRDMVWVALAGPGMNMALAVLAALLYHGIGSLPSGVGEWAAANLRNTVYITCYWPSLICCRSRLSTADGWRSVCFPIAWPCPWRGSSGPGFSWSSACSSSCRCWVT